MSWVSIGKHLILILYKEHIISRCYCKIILDFEENEAPILPKKHDFKVKKSLNFDDGASASRSSASSLSGRTPTPDETGRKRLQDEVFGSLSDDEDLCGKGEIKSISKHFYN